MMMHYCAKEELLKKITIASHKCYYLQKRKDSMLQNDKNDNNNNNTNALNSKLIAQHCQKNDLEEDMHENTWSTINDDTINDNNMLVLKLYEQ